MTFIDKLRSMFGGQQRKSTDILTLLQAQLSTGAGIGNSYHSLVSEGYMSNPDVFACVNEIAVAVSGIPWVVKTTNSDGEIETIRQHPLLTLLNKPNPTDSGTAFKKHLVLYHLIGGRAYVLRVGAGDNNPKVKPGALYLLRPDTVTPIAGTSLAQPIDHYSYRSGEGVIEIPKPMILDLPYFNMLDETQSMSPLNPAASSVDGGNLGRTWNKNLIRNSARPPGGFSTESELGDEQFKRLRDQIDAIYAGEQNAGRPTLLEGGLKWETHGLSPADMEWEKGQKMSTVDICRVYNVAPELIGDSSNKTYSNYQEARVALYEETVLPLLDYLCDEFNNWLTPLYGDGITLSYDVDSIEALQENRDQVYTRLKDAWWLTPNERRMQCGIVSSEDPALDKIYLPTNLIPIELAGMQTLLTQNPNNGAEAGNSNGDGSKSCNCSHEMKMLPEMTDDQRVMAEKVQKTLDKIRQNALAVVKD